MRDAILLVAIMIAMAGCDQITSKLRGDDAGTTAAAAGGSLPADCETFLTRYSCFLKKQGKPTTEADDMRAQWTTAVAQPAARPAIEKACTTQLTTQAQSFKNAGCDGAATAPVAKAAEDAGKAATPATPAPSATAAPNVDAKGRPCKATEAAVRGVCRQLCKSDNQCSEGLVCNGDVPGRSDKVCGDMICKAPEKRLRESHFQVRCAIPCNSNADCTNGKKCGTTLYFNEEANSASTKGCE
jgi:hypothetical protein